MRRTMRGLIASETKSLSDSVEIQELSARSRIFDLYRS
jgi:hypothetical protein